MIGLNVARFVMKGRDFEHDNALGEAIDAIRTNENSFKGSTVSKSHAVLELVSTCPRWYTIHVCVLS